MSESITILHRCVAGDVIGVEGVIGTDKIFMGVTSWWYGHLLEPDNALITSTTDLTVNSIQAASGDIDTLVCSTVSADISSNLAAGANITLTTVAGVTTINSSGGGGGSVDPLNISVGNISTLNTSNSTCDGTLTTSNFVAGNADVFNSNMSYLNVSTINADNINGFIKSTQYAFQVTSNQPSPTNQTIYPGTVLNFNLVEFCYPNVSDFDTGSKSYTCPVAGVYHFGYKAFLNQVVSAFRLGIWKKGFFIGQGGASSEATEGFDILSVCAVGDVIDIRGVYGECTVYMDSTHTWFYGHLLQPCNVAIDTGTDLTVLSLDTPTVNVSTLNCSTANVSTLNVSAFGSTGNLVGKLANYGRLRTTQQDPVNTDTVVYYDFNTESYANDELFTYSFPSGSAATGFRCRKAGWYRYSYSIYVLSRFGNRVQWRGRTRVNNADAVADSFCYTRGADYQYAWEGNCASGGLLQLAVDDYLKIEFQVAKNDSSYGDNFEWLFFGPSSSISFEYLGT